MSIKGLKVKAILILVAAAAALAAFPAPAAETGAPRLHMLYFYNPSCRLCTRTNEIVAETEQKYAGDMSSQRFNIADPQSGLDNVLFMFDLLDDLDVPEGDNLTLAVFLGVLEERDGQTVFIPKRALIEGEEIIEKLDRAAGDFIAGKGGTTLGYAPASFFSHSALAHAFAAEPSSAGVAVPGRSPDEHPAARAAGGRARVRAQSQLRFGAISAAALADSINPCAFATIIILVAMMSTAKRTRREIVAVCLSYTAAVYITYFCIGLFLWKVIAEINSRGGWYLIAADIVYYVAFLLCVVFAILCIRDAWLLFSGRAAEEMTLQLPKAFKKRINVAMAKGVRARWLMAGVFVAGVSVSFLEAACTGQVYLPTILIMAEAGFWQSMMLLAWYNLLFVLPLLIVFGLVLVGITSQQIGDFFKKNIGWTKIALAVVFIIMGAWIWAEMYWPPGYRG
ncbi:MAG: hypothetical protein LBJ46_10955 [Planctomycetota bacterium]|jgi:hypothetical protein|nr:hypothetical protein [Planctomycetota bacterium]